METGAVEGAVGTAAEAGEPTADGRETETSIPEVAEPIRRPEPTSKLSIRGNGLTFERDVPEAVALQIMKLVITGATENNAEAGDGTRDSRKAGRQQSLPEFYREVGPKKIREKLTTFGVYLHEVLDRKSFTSDELKAQFRTVRETPPGNLSRDLGEAVAEGWIAEEHDEPGAYYVTQSGHEAVEDKFTTDGSRRSPRARRKPRKSPKSAVTEAPSSGE